jgi:hypothetical protein
MFASFLENAEIDGTPKPSEIKTDSTSKLITYTVPHFWSYATIDPGKEEGRGEGEGEEEGEEEEKRPIRTL